MPTTQKVLVVGAGAIGAFYASRLAQSARAQVSVLCRSNYKAVCSNGFNVKSPHFGDYKFKPHHTFSDSANARDANVKWDYIIVATKALPDLSDGSAILQGLVAEDTTIVLFQNGIGIEAPFAKRFPKAIVCSAVLIANAVQPSPGNISHYKWTKISAGPWATSEHSSSYLKLAQEKIEQLVELFREGGIDDAEALDPTHLQFVRWNKIAINASINPSAVLSGGTDNPSLVKDDELYLHVKGMLHEVFDTAPKILGQPFPEEFPTIEKILQRVTYAPSGSKPSMLIDWELGKPLELEVILGNPIRLAREHGLEMPRLQSVYALLKMAQANRIREVQEQTKRDQSKI